MGDQDQKRATPAYVPYKTFSNFLNSLRENGLPAQIDRSVLGGMSGSVQSAITSTLEFLGLIDADGIPSKDLHQLIDLDEKDRIPILRSVLQRSYAFLFGGSIDLKRATTKQVEDAFRNQGASGSTVVKCMAFFLAAAKAAEIQVSPHVKTPSLVRSTPSKRPQQNSGMPALQDDVEEEDVAIPPSLKQIKLPLIGKADVILALPADFDEGDWAFLKPILEAYIDRMLKSAI